MPDFDGFPIHRQITGAKFEAAAYELLRSELKISVSSLLYHRIPLQHVGPWAHIPQDILGRQLSVFERAEGEKNVWKILNPEEKVRVKYLSSAVF